ncbi:MAG: EAL domain-containing protein [Lachnospiraceae bacterium]|nr:EAL domain-containing protein [Lachnospiraceae bacterium]
MGKHFKKGNLDELTGLMSYSRFRLEIDKILSNPDALASKAFVYFNIENFKNYNEKYGIEAGDNCLRAIAKTIEAIFSDSINAYMGMDHFCVFTERSNLEERVTEVYEEIRPFRSDNHMQLRAGIYLPTDDRITSNVAVDRAKMACDSIRNQYDSIFGYYNESLSLIYQKEHYIIEHFEDAIRNEYIQVWYQPILRSITEEICGYEALARWIDPKIGLIPPSDFVPVLEKYHMVKKLDLEILEQACRHQLIIHQKKLTRAAVSINLSRLDFVGDTIVEEFDAIVKSFNLRPNLFHVEITESILASDTGNMKRIIDKFRSLGYQVWMDDFGSGYSSLNTLKTYSFDCLKLDMNFLSDFEKNSASGVILKSIINMSKKLGIQTLAEGVSTKEARDFLRNLGCEQMQGFLYSPAVSFNDTARLSFRLESPGIRNYYRSIGKINLLSQNPLKKDLDDDSVYGIPTAIIEYHDKHLRYLAINSYYHKFLNTIGLKSIEEAETFINYAPGELPSQFQNVVLASKASGKLESFDYVRNGQNCNFQVRPIASYRTRSAYLVISMNLSHYSQEQATQHKDEVRRFIYSIYNRVDIIDPVKHLIERVYLNTTIFSMDTYPHNSLEYRDFFTEHYIHELDRQRFMRFYDFSDIDERIERTSKNHVSEYFRTLSTSGEYEWQIYSIIRIDLDDKPMYLSCSNDVDINRIRMLQGMDETMKGMPRDPAFLWLSGRALSNILGYSSYNDFLESSFYFEVNLTQNYVIDYHFGSSNILNDHYYQKMVNNYDIMINDLLNHTITFADLKQTRNFYSRENLIREFNAGNSIGTIEYKSYLYGEPHWLHSSYQLIPSTVTGEIIAYFLTYDIEKYRQKIDEEKNAAEIDQLTGLYNRYRAVPMIRDYLHKHNDEMCALVMLDLDDFKEVNDHYGHQCGDELLKAFANRLKSKFELYGFACRLGGDEFMGIIKSRSKEFVTFFISDMLSEPITINFNGHKISCTVSAGYVMFPDQGTGYHDLYRMADSAMYNAKMRGKNCFAQYVPDNDIGHRMQLSFRSEEILNGIPGAMIICLADEVLTMITANNDFIHLCGCTSIDELKRCYRDSYLNVVAEDNRDYVLDETILTKENGSFKDFEITYSITTIRSENKLVRATGRCIQNSKGKILYIFIKEIF